MPARFEWPQMLESTDYVLVASRVFEPFLEERRRANDDVWSREWNWKLGFYFGIGDTRLWVPRRSRDGSAVDSERVINFGHPMGKKAMRVLVLAYGTALIAFLMVVLALAGVRW